MIRVVLLSGLRVDAMQRNHLGFDTIPPDPTWYPPTTVLLSVIEINTAMLTASIPIFWPVLRQFSFDRIVVVNEIIVKSEPRADDELELTWQSGQTFRLSTKD